MQWVVTTGRTVDEAKARALDALGIDAAELEFEVVAEPTSTLFGLRTTDARVRARVRPTRPRPKLDRRNRRPKRNGKRRRKGRGDDRGSRKDGRNDRSRKDGRRKDGGATAEAGAEPDPTSAERAPSRSRSKRPATRDGQTAPPPDLSDTDTGDDTRPPKSDRPSRRGETRGASPMSDITLEEQEPTAVDFVTGLVDAFGFTADVSSVNDEDEAVEINVEGEDLGLLVGQRGTTLSAIAELTRTAVAQQHSGRLEGRLRVDVAGYRARRKEALVRFAGQMADKVIDSGEPVALEPMAPPDRKIVHDAVNEIEGVHTASRGEDRRRHVVILPDED